jgi:hypothetical protein
MAMDSFRHRPPNQRRQGQAAPERHRRRTAAAAGAASAAASGPLEDFPSARRRRGFEENVLAWTEGTRDLKSHCNFLGHFQA